MDTATLLVSVLVLGAPLALFFAMRRRPTAAPPVVRGLNAKGQERKPPADFGMARETSEGTAAQAADGNSTSTAISSGAAAAAAGGAYILAAAAARHHASEGGGESPQAQGHEPGGDGASEGGGGGGDGP